MVEYSDIFNAISEYTGVRRKSMSQLSLAHGLSLMCLGSLDRWFRIVQLAISFLVVLRSLEKMHSPD